ncbi:MAG: 2-phosphosulfolactate phosphatase [Bacteroidia bacterium]|nr:2-phosphosulfolactate phosphatase [Bacteroidia bacterium]
MSEQKNLIEVCFSPVLFPYYQNDDSIVVVVDILRATTTICTAFHNCVKELIPVAGIEEAREYKKKGYIVAAERDGIILDFADIGNSPENFAPEIVKGKTVVYSTTNGTQAIEMASSCSKVAIGCFLNLDALSEWLTLQGKNIIILCAGWKNKFNLEDTVFSGALTEKLLNTGKFDTICDSALASADLWNIAKNDIINYMTKAAHRRRLKKMKLDHVIPYCFSLNRTNVIPIVSKNKIINISSDLII